MSHSETTEKTLTIPAELEKRVDEVISHYPVSKRSASMPILHLIQEHFGYISQEALLWAAEKLSLQPINLLELVTFYPMYRQEPAGKHHIRVCRTLSCAMAGSYDLLDEFCRQLEIDQSAMTHHHPVVVSPNQEFSLEFVECLASCGSGPVCMINDDFYENILPEKVEDLIKRYK